MTHAYQRLTAAVHDRLGALRVDDSWLEDRWADPSTRVLVISGTRVRPRDGLPDWVAPHEAPEGLRLLLGERDGLTWAAVICSSRRAREERGWVALRDLLPVLADQAVAQAPLVLHALGLAEWHAATRFCPRCASALEVRAAGHELACPRCARKQFPRTDPAVIMIVTDKTPGAADERCLLGQHTTWPAGRFSTLAGFCEPGETLEDAVRREVAEETGVTVGEVTYAGNQPWPLPSSLMLGFEARATSTDIRVDEVEIAEARWFTRSELRSQAESGEIVLPGPVSISRALIERWHGAPLPGAWR